MKATSGPWCVVNNGSAGRLNITMEGGRRVIAQCNTGEFGPRKSEANARLIAAAPTMLNALERAQQLYAEALPKFNWGASALDANAIMLLNLVPGEVRAAITKAKEGKS